MRSFIRKEWVLAMVGSLWSRAGMGGKTVNQRDWLLLRC